MGNFMSFSSTVKNELASIETLSTCCFHAQVYGLVLFAHFASTNISILTENETVADFYSQSLNTLAGVSAPAVCPTNKMFNVSVNTSAERMKIFNAFGHSKTDLTLRINRANFSCDECMSAFLRGVFLACGTVTDPEKNYHLEFVVSYQRLCFDLMALLEELGLKPKYISRKGNHVIYFKVSESIEDVLTVMGATNSTLSVMGVKIEKDIKNRINRRMNFEMSNLSKTINASSIQIEAIELIDERMGIENLPENLREIATLRKENPDISLKELGAMLKNPISRSGVNHRLNRLVEISKQFK